MMPVTHGMQYTGQQVWLYSVALAACTLLPFAVGMSGLLYLAAAVVLNAVFLRYGWLIHKRYSDQIARKAFAWSIVYLSLLFAALLVDHYFKF
jgi:protoheme IX farnesyltransferase